jgi:hypothetical protein
MRFTCRTTGPIAVARTVLLLAACIAAPDRERPRGPVILGCACRSERPCCRPRRHR